MGKLSSRKLKQRLVITVLCMLCCVAIMGVGAYAASNSFSMQITNSVNIDILHVDGTLYGIRKGDCLYGNTSQTLLSSGHAYNNASLDEYVLLYDNMNGRNALNMEEIEKPINFNTSSENVDGDNFLAISYVFKFEFNPDSQTNVEIKIIDNSTDITDRTVGSSNNLSDLVKLTYKYSFSQNEPNWETGGTTLANDTPIIVQSANTATHNVYIMAELKVKRTDKLAEAFTLGRSYTDASGVSHNDAFVWKFTLDFNPMHVS